MTSTARLVAAAVRADPAERRRARLLTLAATGAGTFLVAASAIAALRGTTDVSFHTEGDRIVLDGADPVQVARLATLAPYLAQSGLRGGVLLATLLLAVPFAAFGHQLLRLGSAARLRRSARLRLAGASCGDLRRIAATGGGRSGLVGGLLAGPVYLLLWVLVGVLLPPGSRLLPPLGPAPLIGWLVAVPLLTVAAALAAAGSVRAAASDPLGGARSAPRPLNRTARWRVELLGTGLACCAAVPFLTTSPRAGDVALLLGVVLLLGFALSAGPVLMEVAGRLSLSRPGVVRAVAGGRLLADPRTPGRVAGAVLAVGLGTGIGVAFTAGVLDDFLVGHGEYAEGLSFYLGGGLLALAGVGLAMVLAAASLLVGATEQVLDGRRPTAALTALGASPRVLRAILRRQLLLAAAPPAAAGAALGWALYQVWLVAIHGSARVYSFAALPAGVLVATVSAALGALLAVRLMRRSLAEATAVENLRAA